LGLTEIEQKLGHFHLSANEELQKVILAVDKKDPKKITCRAEYIQEIVKYFRQREGFTTAKIGYLIKTQSELTENIRAQLVDWMIGVSDKMCLLNETLYLAVNILDRYLSIEKVTKAKLPIFGVTAIHIAAKVEEIYPPSITDIVMTCERGCSREEIHRTEILMLKALKYDILNASVFKFIERYTKLLEVPDLVVHKSNYYAHLLLLDYNMLNYLPSLLAAGAIYLACHNTGTANKNWEWNLKISPEIGHKEEEVVDFAKKLPYILRTMAKGEFQAARKKFTHKRYMEVSKQEITEK
jgi:cyclin B